MKVNIEVSMDDIASMLSETEQHTPLEVALMRKCMKLFENLERTNNEKNRLFGVVYRNYLAIDRMFGDAIRIKRKNELANESKRLFSRSVKMNSEAAGLEAVTMNLPYTTTDAARDFVEKENG